MKYLLTGEESARLKYRLLEPGDFDTWMKLFEGKNVSGFLGMANIPTAKEQCQHWFNLQKKRYENDLGGMNVLVEKATGKLVGQCGLLVQELDGQKVMEIGYSVLPEFWGKGFAPEAARKCRDFAFENNFADFLISIIHLENSNSEKVAIKNGMKNSGQSIFKEMPVNIYKISKSEWQNLDK